MKFYPFLLVYAVLSTSQVFGQNISKNHSPFPKNYYFEYYDQGYFVDMDKDMSAKGRVIGTDEDGDSLVYFLKDKPVNGFASVNEDGTFNYLPSKGFIGLDQFTVEVNDRKGGNSLATIRACVGNTKEDFMKALELRFPNSSDRHPRLIYTDAEIKVMIANRGNDPFLDKTITNIIKDANALLNTEPERKFAPGSYRGIVESRYINFSLAYKFTGNKRYLNRFVDEINVSCDENIMNSWGNAGKGGEIDFGEILNSLALGYDLLYNDLTIESRTKIENAIVRNCYARGYDQLMSSTGIYGSFNNYNAIGSAGFAFSAMAICDGTFGGNYNSKALAQDVLAKASRCMERAMISFKPDGAFYEGLGYGLWAVRHLAMPVFAIKKVFGVDLPEESTNDYFKSPEWFNAVQAGAGEFGNGEDGVSSQYAPTVHMKGYPVSLFLAKKANRPDYAWLYYHLNEEKGGKWQDFLFYDPNIRIKAEVAKPQIKDIKFRNYEMAVLHSDYGNTIENAISLYAGTNIEWHMALEVGSIQLNALGTPWLIHLGRDNYNIPNYGKKSNVYRKRAEGRNTLVINPYNGPDQDWCRAKINNFYSSDDHSFAIADITKAYQKNASSVVRGVKLFNHKSEFLIQDEITTLKKSEIYSFFHTGQKILLEKDGKTAILKDTLGNRLYMKILFPITAKFSVMDPVLLPQSPNVPGQNPNKGYKKLAIHLTDIINTTITVWAVPLKPNEPIPDNLPSFQGLISWE
jgi:hypothetical protein